MRKSLRTAAVLPCLLPALARTVAAGPYQDDLKARRARAMEKLGTDSVAIFWSAPPRVYSLDVNYEYRQDSNLLYLTGIDQEDTVLVLMPGNPAKKEILFVREADARREHWNGHSLTPKEAAAASGVETVLTMNQFEPFVISTFSRQGTPSIGADETRAFHARRWRHGGRAHDVGDDDRRVRGGGRPSRGVPAL